VALGTMRQAFACLEILTFFPLHYVWRAIIGIFALPLSIPLPVSFHPAALLSNLFVRDPFLCYIEHRSLAHPAETTVVKRFQFLPFFFFQSLVFTDPE
jgi:hypothetical protein